MALRQVAWACARRWRMIVLLVAAAMVLGLVTAPGPASANKKVQEVHYTAVHTLITVDKTSLPRLVVLSTTGDVPNGVARSLKVLPKQGIGQKPKGQKSAGTTSIGNTDVTVEADGGPGILRIRATDKDAARATKVADGIAAALLKEQSAETQGAYDAQWRRLDKQRQTLKGELDDVNAKLLPLYPLVKPDVPHPSGFDELDAQRQREERELSDVESQISQLVLNGPGAVPITTLQSAIPVKVVASSGGISAPRNPATRVLAFGTLALLLGVALAFGLERASTALAGIAATEAATNLPVISEIPFVKMPRKSGLQILTHTAPASRLAEAYRGLRTSVSLIWYANSQRNSDTIDLTSNAPRVIMVVSPSPGDGKSTTVGNLAVAYAELGDRVIVVDLDSRRQRLHRALGADAEPHLENAGTVSEPRIDLRALLQPTEIPGVAFVSSPHVDTPPGEAMVASRALIEAARSRAEVVIIDTPPLLLSNIAFDITDLADAVVLLVRDGQTKRAAAERASLILRRLDAPVVGVAVVGALSSRRGYGYGSGAGARNLDLTRPPRTLDAEAPENVRPTDHAPEH